MTRPAGNANELDFCVPITMAHGQGGAEIATDRAPTLTCNHEAPIAFQQTADCLTAAYGTKWNGNASATNGSLFAAHPIALQDVTPREKAQNGKGWNNDGTAYTVDTHATQGVAQPMVLMDQGGSVMNVEHDMVGTLRRETHGHEPVVMQPTVAAFKGGQGSAAGGIGYDEHVSPTLSAADSGSNRTPALLQAMQVRRLTPVECERLQGFPDNYTAIPWRKKPAEECPDGPRYKALGNSWAVPVVRWIGKRIDAAIKESA